MWNPVYDGARAVNTSRRRMIVRVCGRRMSGKSTEPSVCRRMSGATTKLLRQSREGRGDILGRWVGLVAWSGLDGWVVQPGQGALNFARLEPAMRAKVLLLYHSHRPRTKSVRSLACSPLCLLVGGSSDASGFRGPACLVRRRLASLAWRRIPFLPPASRPAFLPQAHDLGG